MKKKGIIYSVLAAIKDPERDFNERMYLALTIVSEQAAVIALIGDILTKESPYEIMAIIMVIIFVPLVMLIFLRLDKLLIAMRMTVLGFIVLILPALYFFGGGIQGGGFIWIIFTFIYVGLVIAGTGRISMFALIVAVSSICYMVEYFHPENVYEHSRKMFFIDSYISLILVGIVCFAMTWLQSFFFKGENARATAAAKKAEELTKAQNHFFSSMSHEIRTPINSILGLNELILRDQSISENVAKDATGIQGAVKMLLALINDILDLSKMEAGKMEIVPVNYNFGELLSEIVNMIWTRANEKGLRLDINIDPRTPSVLYGDEMRIKQILINILNNAVKYTSDGSVGFLIESLQKDENTVELAISVTDTGIGIKKESLPYLFDSFKRVEEDKNRHIEGTGLGLSIVKQLIDLMGGTITVDSVYGSGSTFVVTLSQGISDVTPLGELNFYNGKNVKRKNYEASFKAPDAKILIVDDNELNLEIESQLLSETEMIIHKAMNGKTALEYCLNEKYDAILMDHVMPEMDGIECFHRIRNQDGGVNRATPVVILTANAGAEDKEIYNAAGFDGYLIKPVSGETLEGALMRFISADKLVVNRDIVNSAREDINAATGYYGKMPVIITSSSMCDLPTSFTASYIPVIPFLVKTEEGEFQDGVQMEADELIRYINSGKNADSVAPDENAYRDFFAMILQRAHHVIHIAMASSISNDYEHASEAAKSFENVFVINSECVSSAAGILILIAIKLAQMNTPVNDIVAELEEVKKRIQCNFIIDNTEYMARNGLINKSFDRVARELNLHPFLKLKDDKKTIGGFWAGKRMRAYKKYIAKAFPVDVTPDQEVVFVTYVDVPVETLRWIKEEISKVAYFENVVFKQASAAVCSNCGPGAFGIFYFVKSNKSYNLSSFFMDPSVVEDIGGNGDAPEEDSFIEEEDAAEVEVTPVENAALEENNTVKWYENLEGIDYEEALKHSGSEEAFRTVAKIFYDSIEGKAEELNKYYDEEDFKDYTIKVHALKSSCKLIGAMGTSKKAEKLEHAGKEENYDYIRKNHKAFMEEYKKYKDIFSATFENEGADGDGNNDKPVADEFLMESVYEGLREGAEAMDCDVIDEVLKEMDEYAIPESEQKKFKALVEKAGEFDYQGILKILDEKM